MRRLIAIVVVLALVGFGASRAYDWWNYNLTTPVSNVSQPVVFHVQIGEVPSDIANDLSSKGLLRSKDVFEWYVRLTGIGPQLQAGSFVLNRNMSMVQIAKALQSGHTDQRVVTIPEGYPLKFAAQFVEKDWPGMGSAYLTAANNPSWAADYDFLKARPKGAKPPLEGYLFPDTYQVDPTGGVITPLRPAETIESIVILASMVEREADRDPDRGNVCSVYYNRLARGIPLGVDATLLYGLGRLTPEPTYPELQMNTPWNTRKHAGLPPGPISNPGKAALIACINPPQTQFLYYFTDRKGMTHFETNDADFERDKQLYGVSGS